MYNGWIVFYCDQCNTRHYVFEKLNKDIICACGNKKVDIAESDELDAVDYISVCKEQMKKDGLEKYIYIIDEYYDELRLTIANDELFDRVVKVGVDQLFKLMNK
jgi:hypothetical protein